MNFEKYNTDKYNGDDDLNFIPLNIESALSPNSTKFPLIYNMDGISISQNYGAISLGFPNLNINPSPIPLNNTSNPEMAPLMPYPKNISNMESNNDNYTMNESDNNNANTPSFNTPSDSEQLEYPTELNDDFLYSYNEPKINDRYLENSVNVLDILRNFDLSLDYYSSESRKNTYTENEINEIFSFIEKDNSGILAAMKAYRVPYPIAKLLIKKIIKISLDNCKR